MGSFIGPASYRKDMDLRGTYGRHSLDDLFNESSVAPLRRPTVETLAPTKGLLARIQRRRSGLPSLKTRL